MPENLKQKEVIVTNGSGGQLNEIAVSVHYTKGNAIGWLKTRKKTAIGNQQVIVNSIDVNSLSGSIYNAIVTVSASNAKLSKIYTVSLD